MTPQIGSSLDPLMTPVIHLLPDVRHLDQHGKSTEFALDQGIQRLILSFHFKNETVNLCKYLSQTSVKKLKRQVQGFNYRGG